MSALTNLGQTSGSSVTTLPDWYNTAQQNVLNAANTAAAAAPTLGNTVAQGAINTLSSPNNPFTSATNTLGSIASGAANPWITDPNTGAVTPNTNTAMGGLFAAQNQEFNQLLPTTLAPSNANAIGSGNFGSLRGQTAVDTASANALAQLHAAQMQAALSNQQTGVTAAANQGNVAQQGITNAMNVGQTQMTAPFTNAANYGNIVASLTAPQTVKTTQTPSTYQGLTALGSVIQGGLTGLLGSSGVAGLQQGISNGLNGLFSGSSGTDMTGFYNPNAGGDLGSGTYTGGNPNAGGDLGSGTYTGGNPNAGGALGSGTYGLDISTDPGSFVTPKGDALGMPSFDMPTFDIPNLTIGADNGL